MTLRKKKSTFDESDLPTDGWIWGNSRGGGGAPLRDHEGNDVANLKKVLTGAVAVDHSPSPKGKFKGQSGFRSGYDDRDGDSGYGGQGGGGRGRNDGDVDRLRNGRVRNNGGYDADDGPPPRDRRRGDEDRRDSHGDRRSNISEERPREKRQSAYRGNYEDQERVIPGLNDRSINMHDPNSPRMPHHQGGASNAAGGSPKKFMNALKEITGGGDNRERDLKLKYVVLSALVL
jgi:hypothetical protein